MKKILRIFAFIIILAFCHTLLLSQDVVIKRDNGEPRGTGYMAGRDYWEESVTLIPTGPCNVKKILVYYDAPTNEALKDTLWVCGFPTSGNLWPTQYIWSYNSLIQPLIVEYPGEPGWVELDVSGTGLRSDGYDKIVIQHRIKPKGPWFVYDSGPAQAMPSSWITDPFTPNPGFYNIAGTIYHYPAGNFMVRLIVEYDFPDGDVSLPPPAPTMTDVTEQAGLSGGGYVSIVDLNKDGWDDIVIGSNVFENQKNGKFKNISDKTKISATGTAWADIDNDGDMDCYALLNGTQDFALHCVFSKDAIYINNGDGSMTRTKSRDVFELPYPSPSKDFFLSNPNEQDSIHNPYNLITPVFFDYNGDGYPDLFLANRRMEESGKNEIYCPDQLWRNTGEGKFENVTHSSGIINGEPYTYPSGSGYGYLDCYGATACDYNSDGKADIFVANYRLAKDNLFKNNGDGTFAEVGAQTGVRGEPTAAAGYFGHGMGCEWGDFNNDGYPDLAVGNLAHTDSRARYSNPSLIYSNDGPPNYAFKNRQPEMVLKYHEGNAGICWLDLDCDGLLDLWHGKYSGGMGSLYLNTGAPDYKLREITWETGCVVQNPWTAVRLDFDNDGDLDLMIGNRLFRNDMERRGKWLAFRIEGSPENRVSNDAFGTKAHVYAGGKIFYRDLMGSAAGSLCTQNSFELHFGLGEIEKVDSIVVTYPNGERNVIKQIELNGKYRIPYMKEPELAMLAAPAQKSPKNHSVSPFDSYIQLECHEVAGAKDYEFSIYDKRGSLVLFSESPSTTAPYFQTPKCEPHYWYVRAKNGSIQSQYSSMWEFYPCIPKPSKITLISPENDSEKQSSKPKFVWEKAVYNYSHGVNNKYELQIDRSQYFNSPDLIKLSGIREETRSLSSLLEPGKMYSWRVRAYNGDEYGEWSETFYFMVRDLPGAPVLQSPANSSEEVPLMPTLTWHANANAVSYELNISKEPDFQNIAFQRTGVTGNAVKVIPRLDGGTGYFWRVKSVNEAGESDWSETWNFKTEGGTSVGHGIGDLGGFALEIMPNPVSAAGEIKLFMPIAANVKLSIFNGLGREMDNLNNGLLQAGEHSFNYNAMNLPVGIYYCRLQTGFGASVKKIVIIK